MGGESDERAESPRAEPRPLTVFVHVPKTAGTTFTRILLDSFGADATGESGNVFHGKGGISREKVTQLRESAALLALGRDVLAGHTPFGLQPHLPASARYITFLRRPVERMLSHCDSLRSLGRIAPDTPLAEAVADGLLVDNLHTRMLCSREEPFGEVTEEMLAEARDNLARRFLAFGLTERFEESVVLMRRRIPLTSIVHLRHRVTERAGGERSPDELREAADANRYDLQLYAWAEREFDAIVAAEGPAFAVELAALRRAQRGDPLDGSDDGAVPPTADRETLWEAAVRAEARLILQAYTSRAPQRAQIRDAAPEARLNDAISSLERLVDRLQKGSRESAGDKLEGILGQIAQLEAAGAAGAETDAELRRLQAVAAKLQRRAVKRS